MGETGVSTSSYVEGDAAELRTFLIADVRGYTLFTQQRGDEAAAKLALKFAAIAREVVDARGGQVIELRGDEALAVFASARQAIRASVDLQQRFVEETVDDPSLPLPVGIGLDAGEAVRVETGYRGGALNLAARLCGEAGAGEILASQEVVHLARKVDGVRYVDRGELHLKGLADPVRAVKVVPDSGDPSEIVGPFAPPRLPAVPPRSRPPFPRSLVSSPPRLVATVVALALIAAGIPLALRALSGQRAVAIGENAVGLVDAESGRVIGSIELGAQPGAIASGDGSVWVATTAGSVARIDPRERRVTQSISVGQDPAGIAVGQGAVWVTNARDGTVSRINPATNTVVKTIEVGNGPEGIAVGDDAVWVADTLDDTVARIDPGTGKVTATIPASGSPSGIAIGAGAVWVTNATESTVSRIDPNAGVTTATIAVGNGPSNVVAGPNAVWVANRLDGTLSKIDSDTNAVAATFPTGDQTAGIALGADAVWVASELRASVTRLDLGGGPAKTIDLGVAVLGVTLADGTLWFTSHGAPTGHRGGTLTLVSAFDTGSFDPAIGLPLPIASIVGDGLVGFKRIGGVDGSTIVPDLAASIPRPTDDGRTYTFQLRPGSAIRTAGPSWRATSAAPPSETSRWALRPHRSSGTCVAPMRAPGPGLLRPVRRDPDRRRAGDRHLPPHGPRPGPALPPRLSIPSPNAFLGSVTCKGFVPGNGAQNQNPSEFCDPGVDRLVERSQQVQISDPAAAGSLWAAVDRAAVDEAPWVALVTPGWVDVVSKRLGNYEANPVWGMLLDQVWVK